MIEFSQYNESTIESARSEYQFTTWWDSFISGRAEIRSKATIDDSFKGNAFIYKEKQSLLKFAMGVRSLSRIQNNELIIQDTYVSTLMPSVSFGDSSFIKIGVDKSNKYRSLLDFDISSAKGKYITKANLVLFSQDKRTLTVDVSLADNEWKENSITWNYHPNKLQSAPSTRVTLDGTVTNKFSIDLKPFIKHYEDNSLDFSSFNGVILTSNELESNYKTFLSKEYSNAGLRPYVYIEYLDPDTFINEDEIIKGYAMIHGSRTYSDELKGKAYIDREDMYSKIKCTAYIKPEKIDGKASISVINDILKAKSFIVYEDRSLNGKAEIYGFNIDDTLSCKALIPPDKIKCKARIIVNSNINGKATIYGSGMNDELHALSNIVANDNQMKGNAIIKYFDESIQGKALIRDLLIDAQMYAKADIIASSTMQGTASIRYDDAISATSTIKAINDTLTGSVFIKHENQIQAKSIIKAMNNDLKGLAAITVESIVGTVSVQSTSDIQAKSTIMAINNILGLSSIQISEKGIDGLADIIVINVNDDLKGIAEIREISSEFNGKATIIGVNETLSGIVSIGLEERGITGKVLIQSLDSITCTCNIISNNDEFKATAIINCQEKGITGKAIIESDDGMFWFIM